MLSPKKEMQMKLLLFEKLMKMNINELSSVKKSI